MDKKQQIHLWYFVVMFLGLFLVQSWLSQASVTERIPYSAFLAHLEAGHVASVTVRAEEIEGRYRDPIDGNTHFITNIVPPDLTARLEQSNAEFDGTVQNTFLAAILSWVVPMVLIFGLWSFFLRGVIDKQGLGGMMSVGKSRAKVSRCGRKRQTTHGALGTGLEVRLNLRGGIDRDQLRPAQGAAHGTGPTAR